MEIIENKKTEETQAKAQKEYKAGDVYEIPAEGSLGLLALGYRGLVAWREAQQKAKEMAKENEPMVSPSNDDSASTNKE